jgi:hypothetical protein
VTADRDPVETAVETGEDAQVEIAAETVATAEIVATAGVSRARRKSTSTS